MSKLKSTKKQSLTKQGYAAKRQACKEAYLAGNTSFANLGLLYSLNERTIRAWCKKDDWEAERANDISVDEKINKLTKTALLRTLEDYEKNPSDFSLQSLVSLLKQHQKNAEPVKELEKYLMRFCRLLLDFYTSKGLEAQRKDFQSNVRDLMDYIKEHIND